MSSSYYFFTTLNALPIIMVATKKTSRGPVPCGIDPSSAQVLKLVPRAARLESLSKGHVTRQLLAETFRNRPRRALAVQLRTAREPCVRRFVPCSTRRTGHSHRSEASSRSLLCARRRRSSAPRTETTKCAPTTENCQCTHVKSRFLRKGTPSLQVQHIWDYRVIESRPSSWKARLRMSS